MDSNSMHPGVIGVVGDANANGLVRQHHALNPANLAEVPP